MCYMCYACVCVLCIVLTKYCNDSYYDVIMKNINNLYLRSLTWCIIIYNQGNYKPIVV